MGTKEVCGKFGNPSEECAVYGLASIGKDDYGRTSASMSAAVTLVKAGQCHTVYGCATEGTPLAAKSGKGISHVTYCGEYVAPTEAPTPAPTPAPTQAATPAPTQAPTQPSYVPAPTQAATPAPTQAATPAPKAKSVSKKGPSGDKYGGRPAPTQA